MLSLGWLAVSFQACASCLSLQLYKGYLVPPWSYFQVKRQFLLSFHRFRAVWESIIYNMLRLKVMFTFSGGFSEWFSCWAFIDLMWVITFPFTWIRCHICFRERNYIWSHDFGLVRNTASLLVSLHDGEEFTFHNILSGSFFFIIWTLYIARVVQTQGWADQRHQQSDSVGSHRHLRARSSGTFETWGSCIDLFQPIFGRKSPRFKISSFYKKLFIKPYGSQWFLNIETPNF